MVGGGVYYYGRGGRLVIEGCGFLGIFGLNRVVLLLIWVFLYECWGYWCLWGLGFGNWYGVVVLG